MKQPYKTIILFFSLGLGAAACGGKSGDQAGGDAIDTAGAEQIFKTRCTPCHGPDGLGNGSASATLNPKPRNFHDPDFQKRASDEHIERIVQYGGAAVGKSPAMPANPDLKENLAVVRGLRVKVRSFGQQSVVGDKK